MPTGPGAAAISRRKVVLEDPPRVVEATLVALGITLFAAALVPLSYGAYVRGAALAYLGMVSWGTGVGLTLAMTFFAGTLMAGLVVGTGGALRLVRLLAAEAAGTGPRRG